MRTSLVSFTLFALAFVTAVGCDPSGRTDLLDFECDGACSGRWDGTELRSSVHPVGEVVLMPEVDPAALWPCEPDPDVDICVQVDDNGHVGCFWFDDSWAVAVAPSCAVAGPDWLGVGNDMVARVN